MKDLLNGLNDKYIEYIQNNPKINDELRKHFIDFLKCQDLKKRERLWADFKINISKIKQVPELANPFYIGFGNPNEDILFIGKEKGFSITSYPEHFLEESINNILQWQLITDNINIESFRFDPRNPRGYHKGKLLKRHTWGKYAQILSGLNEDLTLKELLKENSSITQNIFNHCFMTEVNHLPSKYSKGKTIIPERKTFLSDDFFKTFQTVIIGAKPYFDEERDDINELFDVNLVGKDVLLGRKGKDGRLKITCNVYKNDSQFIVYCSQLSGASGWTNEALENLITIIKTKSVKHITYEI